MAGEVPQSIKVALRSTLLSRQGGIKQTQLEKEYHTLNKARLCVKDYGFNDLYEFLLALPDVVRLEYSDKDGENKVFGVGDKNAFMSNHARKAQGIPNGKPPLPPAEWPRNKSNATKERKVAPDNCSLKVTLQNGNENIQISPDKRGLYAIRVANLPINCTQDDVSRTFKRYSSLREVKMEGAPTNRISFVRFSQRSDAFKALKENDGYILQGMKIRVRPANQTPVTATANSSKVYKDNNLPKSPGKKSKSTDFGSNPGTSVESVGNCMDTFSKNNNWEVNGLCPLPGKEVNGSGSLLTEEQFVLEENGLYPICVSNFPPGTAKGTLLKEFSRCGDIKHVKTKQNFAFIFYKHREGAILALRTMKALRLGDKVLTVTPKVSHYKNLEQMNAIVLPAEAAKLPLNLSSSHSSISSCDSPTQKTSDTGYGSGSSTNGSTHTIIAHESLTVEKGLRLNETMSKRLITPEENAEKTRTFTTVAAQCTEPLHTLLSIKEMCELMQICGQKTLVTSNNIAPQEEEFDILVTEIVDSCHFWANVDDKNGSYKRLRKLSADLQQVEHYKRCMPLKYDLGAALFSEDNLWYRCWCLEVSRVENHQVKVFFVDYGNSEWTSWDKFTDIPKRFWELAPQAVPFKLAGLEPMSDRKGEVSKEGAKYLCDLICNRVCRARRTLTSKSQAEPHIIGVELLLKDASCSSVNKQMGLTGYVREAKAERTTIPPYQPGPYLPTAQENPLSSQQPLIDQQWMQGKPQAKSQVSNLQANTTSERNDADRKSSGITQQALVASQRTVLNDQSVTIQKLLPQRQSTEAESALQPEQKLPLNQQLSHSDENPQAQQSLPSQLFEKREVLNVKLSYVCSPDELHFTRADETTSKTFNHIKRLLESDVDTSAKIYPRKGDVVVTLLKSGKKLRSKIESVPRSNSPGIDKVLVYNVDDGMFQHVSLKTLCELPSSLKGVPFLAMRCKLAGIKRKLAFWPDPAIAPLVQMKRVHEVLQMSVIRKRKDGVWLVELFDPSGKSLNVQLIENGYALLDEQQCSVMPSNVTTVTSNISNTASSDSVKFPDNASTANQKPWWHRSSGSVSDGHHSDKQSIHSDWEESIREVWDEEVVQTAMPMTQSHNTETAEQSEEKLYMPPPPDVQQLSTGVKDNGVVDSHANGTSVMLTEPVLTNGGLEQDRNEPYSSNETACQPREEFDELETKTVNFTSVESASWKVEREELLHREGELQRILGKSHEDIKRMIHLKQEKEKLERKIRIQEMENQILRLQKELKQLESTKIKLEEGLK